MRSRARRSWPSSSSGMASPSLRSWQRRSPPTYSKVLGPVAYPDKVYFVKDVPKTRSGKIMRRVIKAKALGKETGDLSALANPESVENIPRIDL